MFCGKKSQRAKGAKSSTCQFFKLPAHTEIPSLPLKVLFFKTKPNIQLQIKYIFYLREKMLIQVKLSKFNAL